MNEANALSWQKAAAELTAELVRAETAVGIVKRLGSPGDLTSAEISYGNGRAEAEAVISALIVALETGGSADGLPELEARMALAVAARETLARLANDLAARRPGEKGMVRSAHGHWRLREMLLGGTTRDLLAEVRLPLLMAH